MKLSDFENTRGLINHLEEDALSFPPAESMRRLVELARKEDPAPEWKELDSIDFEKDFQSLAEDFALKLSEETPGEDVGSFEFFPAGELPSCSLGFAGREWSPDFTPDTEADPSLWKISKVIWEPIKAELESTFLRVHTGIADSGSLDSDTDMSFLATSEPSPFLRIDVIFSMVAAAHCVATAPRELVLGNRESRLLVFTYGKNSPFARHVGRVDKNGWTPIKELRKQAG